MLAAIDVGSNTLRMLIGDVSAGQLQVEDYYRRVTRLGGGFIEGKGLAPDSMERTLCTLRDFAEILNARSVNDVCVVGTAALRRAPNAADFMSQVATQTGLKLQIIDGVREAQLSASGVLAVIEPLPPVSLIIDIGGGSTEFILCKNRQVLFQSSYPLGVVRLCEEAAGDASATTSIEHWLSAFCAELAHAGLDKLLPDAQLVATAGTATTLAAMKLKMATYDWRLINNQTLSQRWLGLLYERLLPLSVAERERLHGLEGGRGDLIVPGLQILLALLERFEFPSLRVSDSGVLEGLLLDMANGHG